MIIKFKNKFMMAIEKMIADGKTKGGIPESIYMEADEAYSFLIEATKLRKEYSKHINLYKNGDNVDSSLVLWNTRIGTEDLKEIVKKWYAREYTLFYKDIELRIVKQKKKEPDVPKPKMQPNRIISEGRSKFLEGPAEPVKHLHSALA